MESIILVKKRENKFKEYLVQRDMQILGPVEEVKCCVTQLLLPSAFVVAGHIFPVRAQRYMQGFCPELIDIHDLWNGVLWCDVVELAFEIGCIMCDWDESAKILTPSVLDCNLLGKNIAMSKDYLDV